MSETLDKMESLIVRASAHVRPSAGLRRAQRFVPGVSEENVARLLLTLERGVRLTCTRTGRWFDPNGRPVEKNITATVAEAVRTGLVTYYRDRNGDHLIPARVHYDLDGLSACRFAGETLGAIRARLVDDLAFVDCLNCCDVVSTGKL